MDITQLENLPKRESRKEYLTKKYGDLWNLKKFDHPWHRSDKNDMPWVIADRVIKKFLGKSFDKAFSYYCKLVPKHEQSEFLRDFKPGYRWEAKYILDKQKRIQLNPDRYIRKKKDIHLKSFDYKEGYYDTVTGKTISQNDMLYGKHLWNNHSDQLNSRFIYCVISGYNLSFKSKKDPLYKRLSNENKKAERTNKKLLKKERKNKKYCFLTDEELILKQQNRIQNLRI